MLMTILYYERNKRHIYALYTMNVTKDMENIEKRQKNQTEVMQNIENKTKPSME